MRCAKRGVVCALIPVALSACSSTVTGGASARGGAAGVGGTVATSGGSAGASSGVSGSAGFQASSGGAAGSGTANGGTGAGGGSAGSTGGCAFVTCGSSCADLSSDSHHCGACGHDCLGKKCTAGLCASITVEKTGVEYYWLVLDNGALYYERDTQICSRATNATLCQPVMTNVAFGAHLAVNATNLYVVENGNLWMVPRTNSTGPMQLDTGVAAITADDSYVYYMTATGLVRRDLSGSGVLSLASPSPPTGDFFSGVVATGGSYLYYFAYNAGTVGRVSIYGGPPDTSFSFGPGATGGAVVAAGYLFWTHGVGIRRVTTAGGDPEDLTPTGKTLQLCNSPVVIDHYLYWGERGADPPAMAGRVWRRDLANGQTLLLADQLDHVQGVAVDSQYVYFTVTGATSVANGGVFKIGR